MSRRSCADFVLWLSTLYCGGGPAIHEVIYVVYNAAWVGGACQGHPPEGFRAEHIFLNETMKLFTLSVSGFIVVADRSIYTVYE